MPIKSRFSTLNGFSKAVLLFALLLAGFALSMFLLTTVVMISGNSHVLNTSISISSSISQIRAVKVVQMFSQLGIFIIPPILYLLLTKTTPLRTTLQRNSVSLSNLGMCVAITLLAIPFINLLGQWNTLITLPESWGPFEQWIRNLQEQNDQAILAFSKMPTAMDVITNIVMMAIIPAVGEELLFRGVIQTEFKNYFKNPHVAIWVTAFLFSAFHMQFYGFLSRMILGAIFGYLYYYSGNIKTAMVAHFTNNFLALALVFVYGVEESEATFEHPFDPTIISVSVITFLFGCYLLYKRYPSLTHSPKVH